MSRHSSDGSRRRRRRIAGIEVEDRLIEAWNVGQASSRQGRDVEVIKVVGAGEALLEGLIHVGLHAMVVVAVAVGTQVTGSAVTQLQQELVDLGKLACVVGHR